MSHYLWLKLVEQLGLESLLSRGIVYMEVGLAEVPGQTAFFRRALPTTQEEFQQIQAEVIIRAKFMSNPPSCFADDS